MVVFFIVGIYIFIDVGGIVLGSGVYIVGQMLLVNGWSFMLFGVLVVGDSFVISVNSNGFNDNVNVLVLVGFVDMGVLVGGSWLVIDNYILFIIEIGNVGLQVVSNFMMQISLYGQVMFVQQVVLGVNFDEEVVNFVKYQQVYQVLVQVIFIV